MKKFLAAIAFLLAIISNPVSASAQSSRELPSNTKAVKNPVKYTELKAFSDGRGVWLGWKTSSETNNLGFFVYRVVGNEKQLISDTLISSESQKLPAGEIANGNYSFFDQDGDFKTLYVIESVGVDGWQRFSESFETQAVDDLRTVAGASSEDFQARSRDAHPSISGNNSILPKDLRAEAANFTLPADPAMQRWVAAQPGVKIGIKTEGLYRVSRTALQAGGFDVNAPIAKWQLYVNGVEQAINVAADGSYIEFYGKGIDTVYADVQNYFLLTGANDGKRIGSVVRRRTGSSVVSNSYSQFFYLKQRASYLGNLLNGDVENFFGSFIGASGRTISLNLSNIDFSASTASINLALQGSSAIDHSTKVFINNMEVGTLNGDARELASGEFTFPTSYLIEGTNQLKLLPQNGTQPIADTSFFSSVKINFARRYTAVQNRLSYYVPNYKNSYTENFTSPNIRVFDMTNADAPVLLTGLSVEPSNGGYRVNIPSNRGRVLYAVEDSGLMSAVSITANTPSTLSTVGHNAELVVVSHKNFTAQANTWANYRRSQGMLAEVVDIEDIYDEFNYGATCADCVRDFLSYAKNNWQTAPKYVLIIGDATYDPKNYLGQSGNFVPTRLVDTVYTELGSDDTMADFNDDGLAEIAVGRIPARTTADVDLAFSKVTMFEQNLSQSPARGAFFASDLPDGYDFEGSSQRLCEQLPTSIPCSKVNRAEANAGTNLVAAINSGKYIVNYSGHGNAGAWSVDANFFSKTQAAQLTNANNISIFTMLSCLNGYFIDPYTSQTSLSEVLMENPNGGAAATWASAGLTTPDIQEVMATRFYSQIGAGNLTRIGDLINDAKTTISFGRDVRLSWVLLGDPTMKVR